MSDCRRFEDLSTEEVAKFRNKQVYFTIPKNMRPLIDSMSDEECGALLREMFRFSDTGVFPVDDDGEEPEINLTSSVLAVLRFWCMCEEKAFKKWVDKLLYNKYKTSKRR